MIPYFIRRPFRRHLYNPCARFFRRRMLMEKYGVDTTKYACEFDFWQEQWELDGGQFRNAHYERIMQSIAGEEDQEFLRDKIVADFGCGPRGSLQWASSARMRIGIDVLADAYARFDTRLHDMCYVISTEKQIPLPSNYVDVLFTINAMDHVDNFSALCSEVRRIIMPGGTFVGGFNLGEPPARTEPQTLTEELIDRHLLQYMDIQSYRLAPKGSEFDTYKFLVGEVDVQDDQPPSEIQILGVRATMKDG